MALNTKTIRRRIKTISNIKKVTKAMELVAAAKMRKATQAVLASRSYTNISWQTILRLSQKIKKVYHPLLKQKPTINKIALIVISSNRGLCGGFNSQILQKALQFIKKRALPVSQIDILTLGKKGYVGLAKQRLNLTADFEKKDLTQNITEIYSLSHLVSKNFIEDKYDQVLVAYTDYVSALTQKPRVFQLLPLDLTTQDKDLGQVQTENAIQEENLKYKEKAGDYLLEPNAQDLLTAIVPKIIDLKLYQAVLESEASEHASRMLAMRNATEQAQEMISELTLIFNRARQAAITKEISEISAGKAALEE